MKKAVMIIAQQMFRDEEYAEPKAILEKNGVEITTASIKAGPAKGKLGMSTTADLPLTKVKPADYDAVIFVGGPGCYGLYEDPEALRIAKEAADSNKIVGSICSAGGILANSSILKGKKATVFPSEGNLLKSKGAIYTGKHLEIDGNIITADGPQAAKEFGEALAGALSSPLRPSPSAMERGISKTGG